MVEWQEHMPAAASRLRVGKQELVMAPATWQRVKSTLMRLMNRLHYSLISTIAPDSLGPYDARLFLLSQFYCTCILRTLQRTLAREDVARHIKENCCLYTTIGQTLSRLCTDRRIRMLSSVQFIHSDAGGSMPWTAYASVQPDQPPGSFLTGSGFGLTS